MVDCCHFVNIKVAEEFVYFAFQVCGSEISLGFDMCDDDVSVVVARGGLPGIGNHVFSGSRQRKGMVSFPLY